MALNKKTIDKVDVKGKRVLMRFVRFFVRTYQFYGLAVRRKNSTKKLWSNLNKICSFKKISGTSNSVRKLLINNTEVTEPNAISNTLNNYFSTVGENLVKDIT